MAQATATGKANATSTTFSMICDVSILIAANPSQVWAVLTDADNMSNWNSTIISLEGNIAHGETIKLKSTSDSSRTFSLKITTFEPNSTMVWEDGMAPMFKGVRTYTLTPQGNDTIFTMSEKFSGIMLPMIRRSLPDFKPFFEQFAADLKQAVEKQ